MTIIRKPVEYHDGDYVLEGMLCYKEGTDTANRRLPCVIVCHAFQGRSEFEVGKAVALAELGYVGFALDMYGKGVCGKTMEENRALLKPFIDDRLGLTLRRLKLAVEEVKKVPFVDSNQLGAIGFCFGGVCVLDMARAGLGLKAVVSLHGLLDRPKGTPEPADSPHIETKVQVLHGYDDPMVPPEQLVTFMNEMTARKADWQLHSYGNAGHGFTKPGAEKAGIAGVAYEQNADKRSWQSLKNFFEEVFTVSA